MSHFSSLLSKTVANTTVHIDGASHGLSVLNAALTQLQLRLDNNDREGIVQEAAVMREAAGKVIELAYRDFEAFSEQWECSVSYYRHPCVSNVFAFYFKQKNAGGRDLHFSFRGLNGATVH